MARRSKATADDNEKGELMKIGISGYTGRVGQLLVRELQSGVWSPLELAAASTRHLHPEHAEIEKFLVVSNANDLMNECDCVIDFTTPESTLKNLAAAIQSKTSMVIGTTGLSAGDIKALENASKSIPIVFAANMSVGVNLLLALVEQAAAKLNNGWDIEIFESHHKNKIDAPSGTALALGKAAAAGRKILHPQTPPSYTSPLDGGGKTKETSPLDGGGRVGGTPRPEGQIGYAVSRGGDVVGEHVVTFYGMGERLELGHKASDRSLFAKGALTAAKWLNGKPTGLYSMRDVLGI